MPSRSNDLFTIERQPVKRRGYRHVRNAAGVMVRKFGTIRETEVTVRHNPSKRSKATRFPQGFPRSGEAKWILRAKQELTGG